MAHCSSLLASLPIFCTREIYILVETSPKVLRGKDFGQTSSTSNPEPNLFLEPFRYCSFNKLHSHSDIDRSLSKRRDPTAFSFQLYSTIPGLTLAFDW